MNKWAVVLVVMCGACGGDGGGAGDTGPLSPAEADRGCRASCEHEVACDPTASGTFDACVSSCVADVGGGGVRTDAFEAVLACITDLACTAADEPCLTRCEPTDAHLRYEDACRTKAAECGGAGSAADALCTVTPDGVDDDIGFICLFTPAVVDEMAGCFALACADIEDCLSGVTRRYGL